MDVCMYVTIIAASVEMFQGLLLGLLPLTNATNSSIKNGERKEKWVKDERKMAKTKAMEFESATRIHKLGHLSAV